ncbi:MAG: DUF4124 domain-containing protein [Betaproteobacteria bacterium]|nr:DUF4124 domain-containing protein [Betaproteobacteria bacterium]
MNKSTALVATILLALLSLTVGAQVYRWVDKDGKVQYSDQPPPPGAVKSEATRITSTTPTTSGGAAAAANTAKAPEKPKSNVVDATKAKSAAEEAQAAKENEEYCRNLRAQIKLMEDGGRVTKPNDAGEREIMSDEQMAAEAARLRKAVADNCK